MKKKNTDSSGDSSSVSWDNIGERIKFGRTLLSLSQGEFANKLGMDSKITVYRYEKNQFRPDHEKIKKIARLCRTTISWLYTGTVVTELCDKLVFSIKKSNSSYKSVALQLGVTEEFLTAIKEYKISPSFQFVDDYSKMFELLPGEHEQLLRLIDKNDYNLELIAFESDIRSVPKKNKMIDEIINLLMDDESAQLMVLDLLRSLKKRISDKPKLIRSGSGRTI